MKPSFLWSNLVDKLLKRQLKPPKCRLGQTKIILQKHDLIKNLVFTSGLIRNGCQLFEFCVHIWLLIKGIISCYNVMILFKHITDKESFMWTKTFIISGHIWMTMIQLHEASGASCIHPNKYIIWGCGAHTYFACCITSDRVSCTYCLCSTLCIADELSGNCADSPSLHLRHLSDASFSICLQTLANSFMFVCCFVFFTFDMSVLGPRVQDIYSRWCGLNLWPSHSGTDCYSI